MTTTPLICTVDSTLRIMSTAAWSAAFLSPCAHMCCLIRHPSQGLRACCVGAGRQGRGRHLAEPCAAGQGGSLRHPHQLHGQVAVHCDVVGA